MLDALEPLAGARVLDFACRAGVSSAWLAQRGARVVGLDVSGASIARARELSDQLKLAAELVVGDVSALEDEEPFDAIAGRWALHHVDCSAVAPALAKVLRPGGRAAFFETMALFPLFPFLRSHLARRWGIDRVGTLDEHPLTPWDLAAIQGAFGGSLRLVVGKMFFFRLFDRQGLQVAQPARKRLPRRARRHAASPRRGAL